MASTETLDAGTRRILRSKRGPIGWLSIDNPTRLNAMSFSMWGELLQGVEALDADDEVRVIVVSGHGGRAFCAGGDISEFDTLRAGPESMNSYDKVGKAAMKALREIDKPTIALLQGFCLGGGMGLALQCDLRFAAENAKLGIPAAKRGVAYDFAGINHLVGLVGPAVAKDILFTARQIGAPEALAMGLINQVRPEDEIEAFVEATALQIAENAPLSVRASKLMVGMATKDPDQRDLALCLAAEVNCLESEDYQEATRSFMEKRRPHFLGR